MKLISILLEIILEELLKKHIQYLLVLNILQFLNGVRIGFGKNIKKNQDMFQMGSI